MHLGTTQSAWDQSTLVRDRAGEREPQSTGSLSRAFLCPGSPAKDLSRYFSILHESQCPVFASQGTQRSVCSLPIKMSVQGWTKASASQTQPSVTMLAAVHPYILAQSPVAWRVLIPIARFRLRAPSLIRHPRGGRPPQPCLPGISNGGPRLKLSPSISEFTYHPLFHNYLWTHSRFSPLIYVTF